MRPRRPGKGHHPRWGRILRGSVPTYKILRLHYPNGRDQERPAWAKIAYRAGWISLEQMIDAKPWPGAPVTLGLVQLLYNNSPLFSLPKKSP